MSQTAAEDRSILGREEGLRSCQQWHLAGCRRILPRIQIPSRQSAQGGVKRAR